MKTIYVNGITLTIEDKYAFAYPVKELCRRVFIPFENAQVWNASTGKDIDVNSNIPINNGDTFNIMRKIV